MYVCMCLCVCVCVFLVRVCSRVRRIIQTIIEQREVHNTNTEALFSPFFKFYLCDIFQYRCSFQSRYEICRCSPVFLFCTSDMTDYSASLIHVYNQAPSSAFMDPEVRSKLHAYQHELLPTLYPETRRLASMVTLGPRILFAHLINSRYPNRSMEKSLTGAVPADDRPREAFPEASALSETNHVTADQPLNTSIAVSGDGVIETVRSAEPSACSISSVEPSIPDRLISHDPDGIRHTKDDDTQVERGDGFLISQHKHFDSPDGEVEEVSITMISGEYLLLCAHVILFRDRSLLDDFDNYGFHFYSEWIHLA